MIWLLWVGVLFSCQILSDGNFCIYVEKTATLSYISKNSAYSIPVSSVLKVSVSDLYYMTKQAEHTHPLILSMLCLYTNC